MKYMLLIYGAESCWTEDERNECMLESMAICDELEKQRKWLASSPLHSVTTATCVRVRDGRRQVTDGPFAETTEQLGGYYIIDVADLDEAIAIAGQLPPATKGTVEIRPLLSLPDSMSLPEGDASDQPASDTRQPRDYILLMYAEEGAWPPEEHAPALAESVEVCHQLHSEGQFVAAAPLQTPETATCVRVRSGSLVVVDGPFPETKEQLGGYFLIRVANLDEAISIAARIPGSRRGTAEIRPLFPLPELPENVSITWNRKAYPLIATAPRLNRGVDADHLTAEVHASTVDTRPNVTLILDRLIGHSCSNRPTVGFVRFSTASR